MTSEPKGSQKKFDVKFLICFQKREKKDMTEKNARSMRGRPSGADTLDDEVDVADR